MHNSAVSACPRGVREKCREWTEKMSVCTYLVLFPHGAREKCMWMDWKNACGCAVVLLFSRVQQKNAWKRT